LDQIVKSLPIDGEYRDELPELRHAILREGIFLLHKAAHVLGAAECQAYQGAPTWSLSTGYQAAFFCMESILRLLGIAIIEVNNKTFTVDVWPEVGSSASKAEKRAYKIGDDMQFIAHQKKSPSFL
jgi:hypothetical protein